MGGFGNNYKTLHLRSIIINDGRHDNDDDDYVQIVCALFGTVLYPLGKCFKYQIITSPALPNTFTSLPLSLDKEKNGYVARTRGNKDQSGLSYRLHYRET